MVTTTIKKMRKALWLCLLFISYNSYSANYFWVGGSGSWSQLSHWSNVSGGGGGNYFVLPDSSDNVIFDASSFSSPGATVAADVQNIQCRDFNWSGVTNNPRFILDTTGTIHNGHIDVFGSFTLSPQMIWQYGSFNGSNDISIGSASPGHIIDMAGNVMYGNTVIHIGAFQHQTGMIIMASDITTWRLHVNNGFLYTNDFNINAFNEVKFFNGSVSLTSSVITTNQFIAMSFANVNPGTAFIYADDINVQSTSFPYHVLSANHIDLHNAQVRELRASVILDAFGSTVNVAFIGADSTFNTTLNGFNSVFGKAICRGNNFRFQSNSNSSPFTFDTLFLATSGATYSISDSDTISVNNRFIISNGQPGNLTSIRSSGFPPNTSAIICNGDTVCTDYVSITDVVASGTATFFAGVNSTQTGNVTGWNFTVCTINSKVYPGDTDYDLQCSNGDILNIGLAYNDNGPPRPGATLNYLPGQPAPDWPNNFNSGVNHKHADTNGDGTVNVSDTTAVSLNYGNFHPARFAETPVISSQTSPVIRLLPSATAVFPGAHVTITVECGTPVLPVGSIYGLKFSVNLDPALIYLDSITTSFAGSWFGNTSLDLIAFNKLRQTGQFDFALVRTNHQNIFGGNGLIAQFDVVIVDNVSTITSQLLRVSDVTAITKDEVALTLSSTTDSILIDPSLSLKGIDNTQNVYVYPNPATEKVYVQSNSIIKKISISNSIGETVGVLLPENGQMVINTESFPADVYIFSVYTEKTIYHRRVVVNKR
jgi:hypothetical protein